MIALTEDKLDFIGTSVSSALFPLFSFASSSLLNNKVAINSSCWVIGIQFSFFLILNLVWT